MTILETLYEQHLHPASLPFMFVLLPALLLVYYLCPIRYRPAVLLAESVWCYYMVGQGRSALLLMLASVAVDFVLLRLMDSFDSRAAARRVCFWISAVKSLALILCTGALVQLRTLPQILGVQYYTLSAMSCLYDAYRRKIPCERSIVRFGLYCLFFPRLYAGPMQPYGDFAPQLVGVRMDPGGMLRGWGHYVQGAFKMSILGRYLFTLYREAGRLAEVTALSSWVQVFALAFSLYFLLSGLGDMAQGIGLLFGLRLPRNFYYPYQSRSVEDFFDRFMNTISKFLRETVYTGLLGHLNGPLADALNIMATGMLFGLWFGLRLNYLLWGAYLALFVVLERYVYPKLVQSVPTLFCRLCTLGVVLASFPIFAGSTPTESLALLRCMFRFGHFYEEQILYLLSSNWLLLVLSLFFATNAANLGVTKLRRRAPRLSAVLFAGCDAAILVVFVALTLSMVATA